MCAPRGPWERERRPDYPPIPIPIRADRESARARTGEMNDFVKRRGVRESEIGSGSARPIIRKARAAGASERANLQCRAGRAAILAPGSV